jgi:cytochrome c2
MRRPIPFLLVLLAPSLAHAADPYAAAKTIIATQCSSCHRVPGVPGALGDIGPSLKGIAKRPLIAAKLPNMPANMVRWLMHPQQVSPATNMPDLGLSEDQARKVSAYLYTLDTP